MNEPIDRIENAVEDMTNVVAPECSRWTLPAGKNAIIIAPDGHLLVVHADTAERWLETTTMALAAVRERDEKIAKLEAAARKVVNLGWDHGEDCPHRDCDTDGGCNDGMTQHEDGCEATGTRCDCGVADRDVLAALLSEEDPS